MDGGALTGTLDFAWTQCTTSGETVNCSVNDINGVSVAFDEWPPVPDFIIENTSRIQTFISCGHVFNCTVSSDPANGSELEGYVVGGPDPIVIFDDTMVVSGAGCPSQGPVAAEYEITVPEDGTRIQQLAGA